MHSNQCRLFVMAGNDHESSRKTLREIAFHQLIVVNITKWSYETKEHFHSSGFALCLPADLVRRESRSYVLTSCLCTAARCFTAHHNCRSADSSRPHNDASICLLIQPALLSLCSVPVVLIITRNSSRTLSYLHSGTTQMFPWCVFLSLLLLLFCCQPESGSDVVLSTECWQL